MPISDVPAAGAIAVLPFPYADRLAEKRRPALVISPGRIAERHGVVWVVMVTSAKNAGWRGDVPIENLDGAGLTAASVVRPVKIATVDMNRIIRIAGEISTAELTAVRQVLTRHLASK